MRRSTDFSSVVRDGLRVRNGRVVVHFAAPVEHNATDGSADSPALVGLVVSKSVGNSVVRHRVSRRLRAQVQARLDALPSGSRTVVRALPAAGVSTSGQLGADLERALARVTPR